MKKWFLANKLYFIGALAGALGGLLYWKYVGCLTGTCSITSSPYRSAVYFAVFGALITGAFKSKGTKQSAASK